MSYFIFPAEQWQRINAVLFIVFSVTALFAMILGIIFTFAEIKPADRFLTSCGLSTLIGLAIGLVTSPKSFSTLIAIRKSELPK